MIAATLKSLFQQSVFERLARRGCGAEIICVVNGCTDQTPQIAGNIFSEQMEAHPWRQAFTCRVANLRERGKLNAWNQYVHALSSKEAASLIMMDADISIHRRDTLWNMILALENDSQASVTTDRPCKDIEFKARRAPMDRVSMAMSSLTTAASGQLCGQLYCIRAAVARNIYLPKDLAACEDGFIKAMVCTDFLSRPVLPERIRLAADAEHTFEAYTSPTAIFKNQKRQMIGQTMVHVLVDRFLAALPPLNRLCLAEFLRGKDRDDPTWLKRLISEHLERTRFWWRLYPGLLSQRFKHLGKLKPLKRVLCFPAALGSAGLAFFTSFAAWKSLKAGSTDYWPKAQRSSSAIIPPNPAANLETCFPKP